MNRLLISTCIAIAVTCQPLFGQNSDSSTPSEIFQSLTKAIEENYPMLEYAGWNEQWVHEYQERIDKAANRDAAFELMDELVCRLNDYHTGLDWPARPRLSALPIRVEPVFADGDVLRNHASWESRPPIELAPLDGVGISVIQAGKETGLQSGDEIIGVDGVPVRDALAQAWRHSAVSSSAGKLKSAARRMLAGTPGSECRLQIRRVQARGSSQVLTVAVKRSPGQVESIVASRLVEGVPLIRVSRWMNQNGEDLVDEFDKLLNSFKDSPAIIIDVRDNGGGADGLAGAVVGRFLEKPAIGSISFHRNVPTVTYTRTVDYIQPRGPWRYQGRVAVLTNEGCMSATEHFVSGITEAGALLCGTPTSGACGWIRPVDLKGGAKAYISQTFPLHTGGLPSPLMGIAPHIWVTRTWIDLQAGRDSALISALEWIKSGKPVPKVRTEPLSRFEN